MSINSISILRLSKNDEEVWNKLLLTSLNGSYRQSFPHEYSKEAIGRIVETFVFKIDEEIIAGGNYSLKVTKGNVLSVADLLSGFVFKKEPDYSVLRFLVEHFMNWAKKKNASYLRINPWFPKSIGNSTTSYQNLFDNVLNEKGLKLIREGRYTYWLDLSLDEDVLLTNMKKQTRYEVKKGIKSELEIKRFDQQTDNITRDFWNLYKNLGNEKGFEILSESRFFPFVNSLLDSKLASLFFIYCNKKIINISLSSNFCQASYIYGAMHPAFKELNCTSPGPLAQWEMIKFAKQSGAKIYDMGFCPGPEPLKNHPQYNIWRFKYGFGGDHVEFLPIYGKILQPLRGRILKKFL